MIKKIQNFFLKNLYNMILIMTVFIFLIINLYDFKYKVNLNQIVDLNKYYIIFIILLILFSTLIFIICKKNNEIDNEKIPKIFLLSCIILGTVYVFIAPLFTGSDEHNHYYRIYEISEGIFATPTNKVVGSKLPKSLSETFIIGSGNNTTIKYKDIKKMWNIKLNSSNKVQYGNSYVDSYNNTALYSPIQYLPQVIGFLLAKLLGLRPYIIGLLGRLFNLFFYTLLGYFCLKNIPKSKLFYMLILLSPNMLQCATTLSADSFTNSIFLLLISIIFKLCYSKDKITKKEKYLVLILSVIISLCKIVYLPIVFLVLLISDEKFVNGKKEKKLYCMVTIILSVFISFVWMGFTDGIFKIAYDKTDFQKQFILHNLFSYIIIFMRTMVNYIIKYVECLFVGTTMYHSQLKIPSIISFIYVILVSISLLNDKNKYKFDNYKKAFISIIGIIIIGLISTAIYIQCTAQYYSVANSTIEGIQGRYFIPIIFLIPFIFNFKRMKINEKKLYKGVLCINLITYFYIVNQFIL